jgi:hypothetical protein
MAYCRPNPKDAGYATVSAVVLSLALALMVSAMTARNLQLLALAHADLEHSRQQAILDGAHFEAAAEIVRSRVAGPYHWRFNSGDGLMDVVAEPEADKLSLQAAAALPDSTLSGLGVLDPADFKARLAAAAADPASANVGDLDAAASWRACGASVVSPLGQQQSFAFMARQTPGDGPNPASWHIGEAWRVHIATLDGWSDDRIVRFTGDAQRPAAVVMRVLKKDRDSGGACDDLLGRLFGAS